MLEEKEKLAYLAFDYLRKDELEELEKIIRDPKFDVNYSIETCLYPSISLLSYAVETGRYGGANILLKCPNIHIDDLKLQCEKFKVKGDKEEFKKLLKTLSLIRPMQYNFDMIIPRLVDCFDHLDIEKANHILSNIKHNCICMGTGGSYSVSLFASIVLDNANGILTIAKEPRDVLYTNLFGRWGYLLGITYGNKNYGIREAATKAREGKLLTHLLTTNSDDVEDICYKGVISKEHSFISLASTVVPMSILLNYYLKNAGIDVLELVKKMYLNASNIKFDLVDEFGIPLFEIMSGDDTYVASKVLESTIVEAGLGIPVLHEKYSFCHGRSTLSHVYKNSNLIYLVNGDFKELDNKLLLELSSLYKNIIILNSKEKDFVVGELDLTLQSLFLCKMIAEKQNKDLSKVEYSDVVKKLYYYKGGM